MSAAGPMNTGAREWDAETYDAVSDPQFSWGMEVLERLELRGDEAALEATLAAGADKARAMVVETMADVRRAMGVGPAS